MSSCVRVSVAIWRVIRRPFEAQPPHAELHRRLTAVTSAFGMQANVRFWRSADFGMPQSHTDPLVSRRAYRGDSGRPQILGTLLRLAPQWIKVGQATAGRANPKRSDGPREEPFRVRWTRLPACGPSWSVQGPPTPCVASVLRHSPSAVCSSDPS